MDQLPLHQILCEILDAPFPDGEDHCYFSPPDNLTMKYPCIRYELEGYDITYADNCNYLMRKKYNVTIIDEDPNSPYVEKLLTTPSINTKPNKPYVADGLYHFTFTLYFSEQRIKEKKLNESN